MTVMLCEKHPTIDNLIGQWSHGIAHDYYGGSHDYRLVFLADGRGSFTHDGWWTYRYVEFDWQLRPDRLVLSNQRSRVFSWMGHSQRCLQSSGPIVLAISCRRENE